MAKDAFDTLIDIEQKCRAQAKPLPRQKLAGKTWQGIGFALANANFVAPLSEIMEVLPVPSLTELPKSADWFKGVANLRGRVLPITDLQGFVIGTSQTLKPMSRILVSEFEQSIVGFLVSQVLGVQHFVASTLKPEMNGKLDAKFKPYIQGRFEQDDKTWHIVSLKGISQNAEFYHMIKETGA